MLHARDKGLMLDCSNKPSSTVVSFLVNYPHKMPLPPDPFDLMEKELASDGAGDNYFAPDHLSIQGFNHFQGRAPQLYRGPVSDDPGKLQ